MFRPDRIGTPVIHTSMVNTITTDYTLNQTAYSGPACPFNVINGTPEGDFGYTNINLTRTKALTSFNKCAFVQQFTVTQPVQGNVRGIELNASILMNIPQGAVLLPFMARITAAVTPVLNGAASTYDLPTYFAPRFVSNNIPNGTTGYARFCTYRQPFIIKNDVSILAGTYIHGFQLLDAQGGGFNVENVQMVASVRQLNDQLNVEYADTRR